MVVPLTHLCRVCQGVSGKTKWFSGGSHSESLLLPWSVAKVGDLCQKWGKMRLHTYTIPPWSGISLGELVPAIKHGFALIVFLLTLYLPYHLLQKTMGSPTACNSNFFWVGAGHSWWTLLIWAAGRRTLQPFPQGRCHLWAVLVGGFKPAFLSASRWIPPWTERWQTMKLQLPRA